MDRSSDQTRYYRFFGPMKRLSDKDLHRFTHVDHVDRVAFVVLLGDQIVAVGRFDRYPGTDDAEVAFLVEDAHQGRGLGSVLLEHLAAAARERGIKNFVAEVLAQNSKMVRVFQDAGYQAERSYEDGVVHLTFPIEQTEDALAVAYEREQRSESRSIARLLTPVVGGRRRRQQRRGQDRQRAAAAPARLRLRRAGLPGQPRRPARPRGARLRRHRVDPRRRRPRRPRRAGGRGGRRGRGLPAQAGARAWSWSPAGSGRPGPRAARPSGGSSPPPAPPACAWSAPTASGIVNTDPEVRLNASLAPMVPGRGRVGFFAQSGSLGVALLERARSRNLGLSTFVSAGNRADVSGNDLLQYWATDPGTEVVLLHLESFGNPRKFARLARSVGRTKPVVAVKSGRHVKVTRGLAGTSVAVPEQSVAALFASAGVIRVETVAQMFDVGTLLAHQPLPAGRRVAIVGNSTAIGVLVADAVLDQGLELAREEPVDIGAGGTPEDFRAALQEAVDDDGVDAVVAVFLPPLMAGSTEFGPALRDVAQGSAKPIVASFLSTEGVPPELAVLDEDGMPARGSVPSLLHARAGGHRAGQGRRVRPLAAPPGRRAARAARRRRGRRAARSCGRSWPRRRPAATSPTTS